MSTFPLWSVWRTKRGTFRAVAPGREGPKGAEFICQAVDRAGAERLVRDVFPADSKAGASAWRGARPLRDSGGILPGALA